MARFMVKASEFKNVCKAVNDRKLAELKKEIIEILKKQDEKEVKKAIDYFNSQELHYTHLEKSLISGKWIQKAGYGVGTVRIWKGKKYKKIAPGKWARVFDKEGRGTNIAIGKLIARVQKIDNIEDLMAFVMQNKQRFVDENGIDLPVLDKLRAAVDAKNNGGIGSKETSKPAEKTDKKYDRELVDSWKDDYKNFTTDALKEKIEEYTKVLERAKNDNPSPDQRVAVKQNEHRLKALNELLEEKKNKPAEKKEKPVTSKFKAFEEVELNFPGEGRVKGKILEDLGDDYYQVQSSKTGYTTNVFGKDLKKIEVEEEKTQNRSEAMKGNQNAKKDGIEEQPTKSHRVIPSFEPVKSVTDKKKTIASTTKIDDGKVSIPATREIKNEIKQLISSVDKKNPDSRREFLRHVFYDGENMIATDGKQLKVINIGAIDGIEPNKYLKIDMNGKDNIVIEQDEKDYGPYAPYKRVMPENNNQQVKFDNNALKDKIEAMKKDGSIDADTRRITLKFKDGKVYLDNTVVGDAAGVEFEDGVDFMNFDYRMITNALSGNESIMAVSSDSKKAVSISTKVSDTVFMPLIWNDETDYESNRKAKEATDEYLEKKRAQDAADKEDRKKRSITDEAKSDILKNKPEGVTDNDYEDLIDYCNDYYAKLGYDNSTERGKRDIKRTVDNAINQINGKDFEILEMIENPDNKVSRKVFETITAMRLGSNRESAKKAWESWVGKEGVENHKKQVEAEQKQREENARNEKLNSINSKIDTVSKYNGNISDERKDVVRDYLLNLKVKKDEPTYRALFSNYKYKPNDDSEYITNNGVNFVFDKLKNNGIEYFEKYYTSIKDKPMLNFARYVNATMNSENVKKALFDSFLVDNILTMDMDDLEEDEENESLFNDYSAEQPDLFNSTEMKVQEAFNRCGCCL